MRVMMTADAVGGVWTYALSLARAVPDIEILIATMGPRPTRAQLRAAANVQVVSSDYALEWMRSPWRDVDRAGAWLLELAARFRPDLVHLNGFAHAVLPFGVPVIAAIHSCVCTWHRAVHGRAAPPDFDGYRERVTAGLRAASALVGPTRAIVDEVLRAYGVARDATVIPNGCDSALWQPREKQPYVLAAGRAWDLSKGIDALELAAPRVAWPIHIAGSTVSPDGSRPPLRATRPLGVLKPAALAHWMGHAAIYALPARYEPFGLSLVEAALSGAAIVAGEVSSLREVWGDAIAYVRPGDPDALVAELQRLIHDPLARRANAATARARALAFDLPAMGAAYRELYSSLLASSVEEVA